MNTAGPWAYLMLLVAAACAAGGCAEKIGKNPKPAGKDGGADEGSGKSRKDAGFDPFGNAEGGVSFARDADVTADAFFINDPQPPVCGPDGKMMSGEMPGGTANCPDDKNREGCPCPGAGMSAACWPGKRANRNHGICKDGRTTCVQTPEFGLRWGACEGYVLPKEDAVAGPEACGCFSSGTWNLSNLAPCIYVGASGKTYLYSSKLTADGKIACGTNPPEPPPAPEGDWSTSSLNVDCAGQFKLCYTIKAGDVDRPRADDCAVTQFCEDVWYPTAGEEQTLSPLPSWSSDKTECAREFVQSGGYGEMSVIGKSIECDEVDDGSGNPFVFHRTKYCPPTCQDTPDAPGCRECQTGGSGMFNP